MVTQLVAQHALWILLFSLPAVLLWWHVWTGHPSSTLTCACGDPAQEVWFMAWPAWAITHFHSIFFSGAVNVPFGANLLSNTSGPLVGVVLAPVTWLWGPVVSTNVALTLAPGLSAWGCWLAIRRYVHWRPGAVPAAMIYGYSAAMSENLIFGHVSVSVLLLPPLIFASLYETLVRQEKDPIRNGIVLALLVITQFLISPEILVMVMLFSAIGVLAAIAVGWRQVPSHLERAIPALAIGVGVSLVALAYPAYLGLAGPESVSGVLFAIAPISGVFISGYLSPGHYGAFAAPYLRFGGYFGRTGPTSNYIGWGLAATTVGSLYVARRRPIVWLLALLGVAVSVLALGSLLLGGTFVISHVWLPWRALSKVPVLEEILPDQFAPLITLFLAFIFALGLDVAYGRLQLVKRLRAHETRALAAVGTVVLGALALVPVFVTFDMPYTVHPTRVPVYMRTVAPTLPANSVLLTVPYAVSGSTPAMLWQAVDGLHFRLAGGALKTPNAKGGPVGQGTPGSARRILTDLSVLGNKEPLGTATEYATVRRALRTWQVNKVVIDGLSRDPLYASGFLTAAIGTAPHFVHYAWVWTIPPGGPRAPAITNKSLYLCRLASDKPAEKHHRLSMAKCVTEITHGPL
ncbi:MAG TPA: hypothetical protein VHV57_12360 [Acidimicrobiales bacterium]|nr:hypothetical protein [Acidimicrobiales bacterium]